MFGGRRLAEAQGIGQETEAKTEQGKRTKEKPKAEGFKLTLWKMNK
jgi:hypothetical protein